MTFDSAHRSIQGSAPQQLLKITTPTESYYRTTWHSQVAYDGHTYMPIPAETSELKISPQGESNAIEFTLPATDTFVLSQILGVPEPTVMVELIVLEREDGSALSFGIWKITGGTIDGDDCTVQGVSLMDIAWRTEIPSERMQSQCNHIIYDERCTVDPADFDHATTVVSVNDRIVVVDTEGLVNDQWYRGGKIVRVSDGEQRTIVDHVGVNLVVAYPFKNLAATNAVTLHPGCDRVVQTCRDKFDNIINFSGFPPQFEPPAAGEDPAPASVAVRSHRPFNPFTGKVTDRR